ncbi:hypothetical protein IOK_13183, partial [Yersinia enterocolitica subsp. palearctica PhRBD_Ye1]
AAKAAFFFISHQYLQHRLSRKQGAIATLKQPISCE